MNVLVDEARRDDLVFEGLVDPVVLGSCQLLKIRPVADRDDLFDEAVRLVVQSGQASTSMLQRRFRIGFSRAGRLVDMMERDGIVGPADGSKPREILVAKDYYETVDSWPK